jgi:vacuolar-type H+-ATPase subunit H
LEKKLEDVKKEQSKAIKEARPEAERVTAELTRVKIG